MLHQHAAGVTSNPCSISFWRIAQHGESAFRPKCFLRRFLAILAALYQDRYLAPLAIEEPEKAIYPDGLAMLRDVLQEASVSYQVIITTHSPDLISYFPVESLRVVEKVDGETKIGPMSESQYEAISESLFSPCALMRIEGLERKTASEQQALADFWRLKIDE